MSRIAKAPIDLPKGVELDIKGGEVKVKGPKGNLGLRLHPGVTVEQQESGYSVKPVKAAYMPMAGTFRSLINNMVVGVSDGFEKKLALVGVGYRAQTQGKTLSLALGFSHPVEYEAPEGITIEVPSQTEIVVRGCDKQKVGQVASDPSVSPARALQGQGRALRRRACSP